MLVQTTQSYSTLEDAQDSLAGIKNLPGFILGYVLPGTPKTTLVFIFNCPDGDLCRTQKVVQDLTAKDASQVQNLRVALQPFADMDREDCDLNETACTRGTASDMTILTSADFRYAAEVIRDTAS